MVDKSNEYGFVPSSPTQARGSNTGIFEVNDVNDLLLAKQWSGDFGKLELIETQTHSSDVAQVDFTNIKEDIYNVHFMTFNNIISSSDAGLELRLSNDSGSTFESSNYKYAIQYVQTSGTTAGEVKSTGGAEWTRLGALGANTNEQGNGYIYFYNLGDSAKYSFATNQSSSWNFNAHLVMYFGSQVYHQAETINAIRVFTNAGNLTDYTISLYGIAES